MPQATIGLTDQHISHLSDYCTNEGVVRKLGIEGLGVNANFVQQQFTNYRHNIKTVGFHVLMRWRQSFTGDSSTAYATLYAALDNVDMRRLLIAL